MTNKNVKAWLLLLLFGQTQNPTKLRTNRGYYLEPENIKADKLSNFINNGKQCI